MDVYSTWNLICAVENGWRGLPTWKGEAVPNCIRLCPERCSPSGWHGVEDLDDGSQDVLLGKPIVRITHDEIFDEESAQKIAAVIGAWIAFDRENIVRCRAGLHWVDGPFSHEIGKPPQSGGLIFYWNPQNARKCAENLALSAVAMWRVLNLPQFDSNAPPWTDGIERLRDLLKWILKISPGMKQFVSDLET